jgi:hypothetical protein
MRILRHPFFVASLLLYLALKATRHSHFRLPFVHDYLADFLCMPVVMGIALIILRRWVSRDEGSTLSWGLMAGTVALYSFLFEYWFPQISTDFRADPWDVLAYAAGAVAFQVWLNRPLPRR